MQYIWYYTIRNMIISYYLKFEGHPWRNHQTRKTRQQEKLYSKKRHKVFRKRSSVASSIYAMQC